MLFRDEGENLPIFPVVCIGGSAGSLSAYVEILRAVPANAGIAIVVVSHRPAGYSDMLVKLLARATKLEVVNVTDGMLLETGTVFVAPAQTDLTTDGVMLTLRTRQRPCGWPTVIGDFISSMADGCMSRSIAIIVSGMGHDGSAALEAVKEAGGWTLAQSDARHADMPQAAIDTEHVDFVMTAGEIGKYLASLSAHLGRVRA